MPWPRPFGEMTFAEKMKHLDDQVEKEIVEKVEQKLSGDPIWLGIDVAVGDKSIITDHLPVLGGKMRMTEEKADEYERQLREMYPRMMPTKGRTR